jgi:uncharacterized DUF497 family protein
MQFEWDPRKDRANRAKHGLSFEEASRLFAGNLNVLEFYDEGHFQDEDRFIAIGPVDRGVIVVSFAERPDDAIPLFSARMATPRERRQYENYWRGRDE